MVAGLPALLGVTNCSAFYGCAPACMRRRRAAAPTHAQRSGGVEPPCLPTMGGIVQEHTSHLALFIILTFVHSIDILPVR
jgi:hypothetical protein